MGERDRDALLRELLDREQIRDLTSRYADCVWRRDVEGAVALFTDDGVMDTGDAPPIRGREALREAYQRMVGGAMLQPFVHNHVIELRGDTASGTCYLDLRATLEGRSMIGSGYYHDEYARVSGAWRFRSRKLNMLFLVPLDEGWARGPDQS